jgi:hypothetical protein
MKQGTEGAEFFCGSGSRRDSVEGLQKTRGGSDEEMVLVRVADGFESAGTCVCSERGEIDMRGDVLFADALEGVGIAPVCGVAGQRALLSKRGEEFVAGHSIIDGEKMAAAEFRGDGGEKFALAASDFRAESIGAGGPTGFEKFRRLEREGFVLADDAKIFPTTSVGFDEIDWKRVEKFVGKMDTGEFREGFRRVHPLDAAAPEAILLGLAKRRERFDEDHGRAIEGRSGERVENVIREASVVRALFDEREIPGAAEGFPEFDKLAGENFAQHGAEAHARVKIPAASDDSASRGVVALPGIIESQLHEAGKRQGTVGENFRSDAVAKAG